MYPSLTRFPGDLFADFDGLQRQIDQLFGPRGWPSSIRAATRGAFPAINMGVSEEAVEIFAFAPGLDPAKIEVSVDKGLLTIAGERADDLPKSSDKTSIYADERFAGAFRRVVSLPEDADPAGVDASYRDGVLKVAIPKREASRPRRIEIKD
jgi:HSP20 family protein